MVSQGSHRAICWKTAGARGPASNRAASCKRRALAAILVDVLLAYFVLLALAFFVRLLYGLLEDELGGFLVVAGFSSSVAMWQAEGTPCQQ